MHFYYLPVKIEEYAENLLTVTIMHIHTGASNRCFVFEETKHNILMQQGYLCLIKHLC